ncbi:glycine cleavage system protein GcvH [Ferviditalea candida]|uniref:Glycine cleavage system H protein n=1 Tax=Ferviditalea candida TaxID=3108399 RepID=A0ABU5ZKC4_9BACL|nr:glycine cleavage system protein GcvH [Paenibacillaceae bacterium T2]
MAIQPLSQWTVPGDRMYDQRHQWYLIDGSQVTMGITDYTQDTAGDILYVSLPAAGTEIKAGQPIGSIESGKWVGQIYAPFDGVVVSVNARVEEAPPLLNQSPYDQGWMVQIQPNQQEDLNRLITSEAYQALLIAGGQ